MALGITTSVKIIRRFWMRLRTILPIPFLIWVVGPAETFTIFVYWGNNAVGLDGSTELVAMARKDAGFGRDADVRVREDSFACRETSELDRLLQRNQSGGFISGVQLYKYLQSHNCIGRSAGRVRVYAIQGQYVCIYDPKDKNKTIRPCAWTRRDMLSK